MSVWNNFVAIVTEKLEFLETDFGFKLVSTFVPMVEYKSDLLHVSFYWDHEGRYELDSGLQELNAKQYRDWSIESLVHLHNPEYKFKYRLLSEGIQKGYHTRQTKEQLKKVVNQWADLLLEYGADVLSGDFTDFRTLENLGNEMSAKQPRFKGTHKELVDIMYKKYSKEHLREHHGQYQHTFFLKTIWSKIRSILSRSHTH